MTYVDGFVIPIPKKNLRSYWVMAKIGCKVWMEHGALEYRECILDDQSKGMGKPFGKLAGCKGGETVLYSFIVYKSRAHRDAVTKKVMKDPRIAEMMSGKKMPFNLKRFGCAGFKSVVEA